MATGNEILSYQGNAGLGSNSNIPVAIPADLSAINRTTDMLLGNNLARNKYLFDLKKKQQDQLYEAINSGQIKVGAHLDEDRPKIKDALDAVDKAFFERVEGGGNNIDKEVAYNKALQNANDVVTKAQARKHFYDTENVALSQETLPRKQSARKQNLDNFLKQDFWANETPYQQTQDLDVNGSILSTAANISQQFTDPKNPLMKGTRTVFDYDKTLLSNKDNFLNDANKRYDQQQLISSIQALPPQQFTETIGLYNDRINEYNKLKGLDPNSQGYVAPIEFEVNPQTNKAMIKESMPDFAAKFTLAHQKPFGSTTTEFDSKYGAYLQGQQRLGETARHNRVLEGIQWKKIDNADEDNVYGANSVLNEAVDIINKGTPTQVDQGGGRLKTVSRISDPEILKNFGTIDKDGTTTNVPDILDYDPDKDEVVLGYYGGKTKSGKNIIVKETRLNQRTWLKEIAKRSLPNKDIGKVNSIIDGALNQNKNSLSKIAQKNKQSDNETDYENDTKAENWKNNGDGTYTYIPTGQKINSKTGKPVK